MIPTFKIAKLNFFPKTVIDPAERMAQRQLSRFGALVRSIARNSIKPARGPNAISMRGSPPLSHGGSPRYKDTILYTYDKAAKTVYIGPVLLSGKGGQAIPGLLEHGGSAQVIVGRGRNRKRITAQYRARPHMRPAQKIVIDKYLKDLLKNSITKRG